MARAISARLHRSFFERETVAVAIELLGATLVSASDEGVTSGRIVEVEAYGDGRDLASHAARLKNGGVRAMFGEAGIAYVYRSYGVHAMFNIVAKRPGETGAILVRALEPLKGIDLMRARRGAVAPARLCAGPGNLCVALGITLAMHGTDLATSDRLWLEPGTPPRTVHAGERIGISRSVELPWRFFDAESAYISAHRQGRALSGAG